MPPETEDFSDDTNSLEGIDIAAISAEIGDSLGPKTEAAEPETPEAPVIQPAQVAALEKPTAEIVEGQNSQPAALALPKAWKKDMAPHWEKLPPEVHAYVHAREADVMRGIQSYQQAAQSWQNLIQPFAPVFQQHPNVNPGQVMQGLMQTHLRLLDPKTPAAEKTAFARQIFESYGIPLEAGEPGSENPLQGRLDALQNRLDALTQERDAEKRTAYDVSVQAELSAIESFAKDPKNLYFDEVADNILHFVKTGAANSLAQAYELACYANPIVRGKLLAAQQAAPAPSPKPPAGKPFVNLDSATPARARTRTSGTMDETINAIAHAAFAKTH